MTNQTKQTQEFWLGPNICRNGNIQPLDIMQLLFVIIIKLQHLFLSLNLKKKVSLLIIMIKSFPNYQGGGTFTLKLVFFS